MPQSLSQVIVHIVFSTKDRQEWLDAAISPRMHAYLATVCRDHNCEAYRVGGVVDHVHLAVRLDIDRQAEHHRTKTFQEEYRELLRKYHIEFDERYVWD